jgi:hypothetical protein
MIRNDRQITVKYTNPEELAFGNRLLHAESLRLSPEPTLVGCNNTFKLALPKATSSKADLAVLCGDTQV